MNKYISEKQLVAAIGAINAMGPSPISERIFRENIIPGHEKEAARSIAIANFVAKVSPTRFTCDWYTVALFSSGISHILMPDAENDAYTELLLQSTGIPNRYTVAIREANSVNPTYELSALALAIRFADIHVDENGNYVKLKDGIRHIMQDDTCGVEKELMNICYELEKRGKYEKWLNSLDEVIAEGGNHGGQETVIQPESETEKIRFTS